MSTRSRQEKTPNSRSCQRMARSQSGGNTTASAVLVTAPTSEMKTPRLGITSARTTEIRSTGIEWRLANKLLYSDD